MGVTRVSALSGPATMTAPPLASPVDLVGFAASQVLLDGLGTEAGTGRGALQPVLGALVDLFGCAAAIALRQDAGQELIVLAAHPGPAAADQDLLAQLSALSAVHGDVAHRGGSVKAALTFGGRPVTVRLSYAAPEAGRCLCAVALLGDPARFAMECQATTRGIAAIMAAQIRHANDTAELAERLQAEREARRSLADQTGRLSSLIAAAIPGILVSDEHGLIAQINASFCDLFGIEDPPGKLIGTSTADIVLRIKGAFADPSEFVCRTGAISTARQPVEGEQTASADGRTFERDYWPIFVDGDYRGDLWLAWDMSGRTAFAEQRERLLAAELAAREAAEQAQARLAEQNVRLQELDEAKTQFISTMSHELRTPLTSIISFTDLIMDDRDKLAPETLSSLLVIQRNAGRLLRLVGDLLLLSRLEQGVIPLDLAVVSVTDLISEAVSSSSASAADRGMTIDVTVAAGPPLRADPLRIRQMLDNLLFNAIKYTGQDGNVRVRATHDGQRWRIDVSDNGIGIPADELGHLFDRFVRASNARTAGLPGTGLGLAVVKAITELHGGSVEVRSAVGQGTTFSVYLPVSP
jgi:signal transduction histidine kinase